MCMNKKHDIKHFFKLLKLVVTMFLRPFPNELKNLKMQNFPGGFAPLDPPPRGSAPWTPAGGGGPPDPPPGFGASRLTGLENGSLFWG